MNDPVVGLVSDAFGFDPDEGPAQPVDHERTYLVYTPTQDESGRLIETTE